MGNWDRYQRYLCAREELGFALDISGMAFADSFLAEMEPRMQAAFAAMADLEAGAVANPDERRQVGHYWLRALDDEGAAPDPALRRAIAETRAAVLSFARAVHAGDVRPEGAARFRNLLLIGIGGSALGPQLFADALGYPGQPLRPFFFDNTDPDGFDRVFAELDPAGLAESLVLVVSKSGGTKETRNGLRETETAFARAGLRFAAHAVAVTGAGSELDREAESGGWLRRFPMWDWVGGRTSVFSAVGLLPAALLGYDAEALVRGAGEMDRITRLPETGRNPAALLALMWYHAGGGRGEKDMVVLPYRDRLGLFAKYLQQLVMESLGKELDLQGRRVNQGIVVYGNKGSTDQHAYVQQLREGANNFFAVFIEVLRDREGVSPEVAPGVTSGDYLHGFLQGTRAALAENGRESLTLTLDTLDAAALGRLIALFDRAVGLYASLIGINAYHQPGVEAGKRAAERVIELQAALLSALRDAGAPLTAAAAAAAAGHPEAAEAAYRVLRHLAANPDRQVRRTVGPGPGADTFALAAAVSPA
jgi:glucose-6-phosphate isomerase